MFPAYQTLSAGLISPHIAGITLNRPDAANALNTQMGQELADGFAQIKKAPQIRAVILTGASKYFCAGADLKERKGMNESQWHMQHRALHDARDAIFACEIPVIAAVNGSAFGGGLELALACDFIYAAESARMGLSETSLGIMPGMGGTQMLARRIGIHRAKELIFTAAPFTATDALIWGLANLVVPDDKLASVAGGCAQRIAANGPLAVRAAKRAISEGIDLPLTEGFQCELNYYNTLLSSKDRHEGIDAFNEKRKASFTGE